MKPLIQALAKARLNFGVVNKDAKAISKHRTEYKYATIDAIISATAPALAAAGLCVYHTYKIQGKMLEVTCHVTDGEFELTSSVYLPTDSVSEDKNPAQAVGSLLTYGRRYSISALLAICTDADDDAAQLLKEPIHKAVNSVEMATIKGKSDSMSKPGVLLWLERKFDEYAVPASQRTRILAEANGKTTAQLFHELEAASSQVNGHI